jgi:hypothetical protein
MDYIPSIDIDVSSEQYSALNDSIIAQIDNELNKIDTSILHPSIPNSLISHNDTLLPLSDKGLRPYMKNNLADKYIGINGIPNLTLLTSHSQLRILRNNAIKINLNYIDNNSNILNNLLILESEFLKSKLTSLNSSISKKRKLLDNIIDERKRQRKNFKPINDFLNNRWNEKINELAELQLRLKSDES